MTDIFRVVKYRWLQWAVYCILPRLGGWGDENYIQNIEEKTLKGILVFWNVTLHHRMNDS